MTDVELFRFDQETTCDRVPRENFVNKLLLVIHIKEHENTQGTMRNQKYDAIENGKCRSFP